MIQCVLVRTKIRNLAFLQDLAFYCGEEVEVIIEIEIVPVYKSGYGKSLFIGRNWLLLAIIKFRVKSL